MRCKLVLSLVLSLFVLPLAAGRTAAGQPAAQGFRILLSDGSVLKGAVSFTMNLDTQYGRLAFSSANLLSARFNLADQWATIYTTGIELRVQYKPASSDLEATTDLGPVKVDLTKVISVETLYAEVPRAAPPAASYPYDEGSQVSAPSELYAAAPPAISPAVPYDYGNTWVYLGYAAPAPYGYPCYSYGWCPGQGFVAVGNFGRDHRHHEDHDRFDHRHHDRFDGRSHHEAAGRGSSPSSFRGAASPKSRSAAPTFRSGAAPSFRSGATPTFRSAAAPSFRSGGRQSGNAGRRVR